MRFALEQGFAVGHEYFVFDLGIFIAADLCNFLHALNAVFNGFKVFQLQLGVNDFLVAHGVNATVYVYHVTVVEAAEHVDDGIGFADVTQELVAQPFAFRSAFHKSGDVDNFDRGGDDASGVYQFGQFGQSFIGHRNYAHVGFDGAKGKVCRLCLGITQAVKKG